MNVIREYATAKNLSESSPATRVKRHSQKTNRTSSTYSQTKDLLAQKLSIVEIARQRGMTEGTIASHLEKLATTEEQLELEHLRPPAKEFSEIAAAFRETGEASLTPIFEKLKEKYSYDQLRMVRLFLGRD